MQDRAVSMCHVDCLTASRVATPGPLPPSEASVMQGQTTRCPARAVRGASSGPVRAVRWPARLALITNVWSTATT